MVLSKRSLDGNLQTLLLALLESGPRYGYQLVQQLNAQGQQLLRVGEGTVYPVLHRLEQRGLIRGSWQTGENGRRRKYYRLTTPGRRALQRDRQEWAGLVQLMDRFLGAAPGICHPPPTPKGALP